jgi:flagellum-specific peptidoglycan hydrolase FlgJ
MAVVTIGVTAGQQVVKDITFVQPDAAQPNTNLVLDAATMANVTKTVTASQYRAQQNNAGWRAALIAEWQREMALNPSRSQWWGDAGDGNNGAQCAQAQSVVIHNVEEAFGIYWVSNPRVPQAYPETKDWVIWRVDGDGSWMQWADQNPINGQSRNHPVGDGYQPEPGDLAVYGGQHIVMVGPGDTVFGADDGPDLGNHHRPLDSGITGYIDMSLPQGVSLPGHQAAPGTGQQTHPHQAPQVPQTPQSSAAQQSNDNWTVAGGLSAPGFAGASADSGSQGASASPTTSVVPGGIAAPSLVVGAGYADQFHADQPKTPRYTKHNPAPALRSARPKAPASPASSSSQVPVQQIGTQFQRDFINSLVLGAQQAQAKFGVPSSVTIAQAITESAWGQSSLSSVDNNLFGIKGSGPAGSVTLPTQEFQGGQWVTIDAQFRVYHNFAESIDDHGALLHNGYYGAALAQWQPGHHDADAFANGLTGVYATDPNYGQSLIGLMRTFNLYRFNDMPASSGQSSQAPVQTPSQHSSNGSADHQSAPQHGSGRQPSGQTLTPGDVLAPSMLSPEGSPTPPAPSPTTNTGGLGAPAFVALTADVSPAGNGSQTITPGTQTPPWRDPTPPWRAGSVAVPPWRSTPSAPTSTRQAPVGSPVPSAPAQAQLMSYRQPTGAPVKLVVADHVNVSLKHMAAYDKGPKAAVAAGRPVYKRLSSATGVPWQIIAALAQLKVPSTLRQYSLPLLVDQFIGRTLQVGINARSAEWTNSELELAFKAYAEGANISANGISPVRMASIIAYPPGSGQSNL